MRGRAGSGEDGQVVIEFRGVALPARAFAKDARVRQGDIVHNKVLSSALLAIQKQQEERELVVPKRRLTLREEDLMLKELGEPGLPHRRGPGRPSIAEVAQRRRVAADAANARFAKSASTSTADCLLEGTLRGLEKMKSLERERRSTTRPAAAE